MRGILLAGGTGSRLHPLTKAVNKHLLPVFDKPMIYYPLTTLILAGVTEICLVSTTQGVEQFKNLLGDGNQWGISISYAVQDSAEGIAHAIGIAVSTFKDEQPTLVILGDNIFFGAGLGRQIAEVAMGESCIIWTRKVEDPEAFGIARMNFLGEILEIVEKPQTSIGNMAITGLYYFPADLAYHLKSVVLSARKEYEITSILNSYLHAGRIRAEKIARGVYWVDTGTVSNLFEASLFIRTIQATQKYFIGSPEEAAWRLGLVPPDVIMSELEKAKDSSYKDELISLFATDSDI
jgi:glucose-1-phosphate thymidylyltransferase